MFGKRYLAIAVSIFAIGVVFGVKVFNADTFSLRAMFTVIAILSVCACAYFVRYKSGLSGKRIIAATFAVAAFSFGVLRVGLYNDAASYSIQYDRKSDKVILEICEVKENYIEAEIVASEIGVNNGEKLRLYLDKRGEKLVSGDTMTANVVYKSRVGEKYYSNGISLSANAEVLEVEKGNGIFCKLRRFVSNSADELYDDFEYAGPISKAVTIGDKSDFDSYLYSIYNSSGVSHILAISGLHVTLIAFCFQKLLVFLSVSKKTSSLIAAVVVLLYASFVGFTPSVTRAAVMLLAIMLSKIFLERADSITMMFIALGILLFINPYSLFSVSLELSFLASLAILVSEPILDRVYEFFMTKAELSDKRIVKVLYSLLNAVVAPAIMSFSTTVFSFFVILTTFDSVSYLSPIVNILVVPLFSYGLVFALAAFIVSAFCMPAALYIAKPAGYIFDFISDLSENIHKADIGRVSSYVDWILIPCVLSIVMIFALLFLHRNRTKCFAISSVAFCFSIALCGTLNNYSQQGVTIFEYGESDGEYVYFRTDETSIYFDVGGYTSEPTVVFENGFTSIEKYVVTDYSGYSYNSFDYFSGRALISQVYLPKPKNIYEIDIYNEIKLLANKRKYDIIEFDNELLFELNQKDILFIKDDMISSGSYFMLEYGNNDVNLFLDGFPAVGRYDIAIVNGFSEEYLFNASYKTLYFKDEAVENSSYDGLTDTFSSRIRIVYEDGEGADIIYEH